MMLTIHGLPVSIQCQDVKTLIMQLCGLTDFLIDNLVTEGDGTQKIKIGVADESEGAHIMKCLTGYRMSGQILRVQPVAKSRPSHSGKPNQHFKYDKRFHHEKSSGMMQIPECHQDEKYKEYEKYHGYSSESRSPIRRRIRRMSPSGKIITPSGQRVSPPSERMTLVGRRMSPSGKIITPSGGRVTPPDKIMLGRRMSPTGRRVSPFGRKMSPGNRHTPMSRKESPRKSSPDVQIISWTRLSTPESRYSPSRWSPDTVVRPSESESNLKLRYSPSRWSPVRTTRTAHEPDIKASKQAIFSSDYRSKEHHLRPSPQRDKRKSPCQERDKKKEHKRDRIQTLRKSDRGLEHSGLQRVSPRCSRSPIRDRSPHRDRYRRHTSSPRSSPRSPRRSSSLEECHSVTSHEAPSPPTWPGQTDSTEDQYASQNQTNISENFDKETKMGNSPVVDNLVVREKHKQPSNPEFSTQIRIRSDLGARDMGSPAEKEPTPDRDHELHEGEFPIQNYVDKEIPTERSERHADFVKEKQSRNQDARLETLDKNFEDVYKLAVEFVKKTQELRKEELQQNTQRNYRVSDVHRADLQRDLNFRIHLDPRANQDTPITETSSAGIIREILSQIESPALRSCIQNELKETAFQLFRSMTGSNFDASQIPSTSCRRSPAHNLRLDDPKALASYITNLIPDWKRNFGGETSAPFHDISLPEDSRNVSLTIPSNLPPPVTSNVSQLGLIINPPNASSSVSTTNLSIPPPVLLVNATRPVQLNVPPPVLPNVPPPVQHNMPPPALPSVPPPIQHNIPPPVLPNIPPPIQLNIPPPNSTNAPLPVVPNVPPPIVPNVPPPVRHNVPPPVPPNLPPPFFMADPSFMPLRFSSNIPPPVFMVNSPNVPPPFPPNVPPPFPPNVLPPFLPNVPPPFPPNVPIRSNIPPPFVKDNAPFGKSQSGAVDNFSGMNNENLCNERAAIWLPGHSIYCNLEPFTKLQLQNQHLKKLEINKWQLYKKVVTLKGTRLYVDLPGALARSLEHIKTLSYELQQVNFYLRAFAVDKNAFDAGLNESSIDDGGLNESSIVRSEVLNSPMPRLEQTSETVMLTLRSKSLTVDDARKIKHTIICLLFKYLSAGGKNKTDFIKYGFIPPCYFGIVPANSQSKKWLIELHMENLDEDSIIIAGKNKEFFQMTAVIPILHVCKHNSIEKCWGYVIDHLKQSNKDVEDITFHKWNLLDLVECYENNKIYIYLYIDLESIKKLSRLNFVMDYLQPDSEPEMHQVKFEWSSGSLEELMEIIVKDQSSSSLESDIIKLSSSDSDDDISNSETDIL